MPPPLPRRLLAELLGSAFLAAVPAFVIAQPAGGAAACALVRSLYPDRSAQDVVTVRLSTAELAR